MTDPGPILGDTSSQDAAVSELESFSIFDEFLPLFKVFTFQTRDFLIPRQLTFPKTLSSNIEHRIQNFPTGFFIFCSSSYLLIDNDILDYIEVYRALRGCPPLKNITVPQNKNQMLIAAIQKTNLYIMLKEYKIHIPKCTEKYVKNIFNRILQKY